MKEFRIDYKFEFIEKIDDGHLKVGLKLDPERYELKTIDGQEGYWDKFDDIFIPLNLLEDLISSMENSPVFFPSKDIKDIEIYTKERVKYFSSSVSNGSEIYEFCDKSEDFLDSLNVDKSRFVILSIDIVGSTKMSQELSIEDNSKIIQLFLSEISQLIHCFGGYVLKYLGDGIIAYFPEPNYIGMNDNAIDCANSIKYFIINGLNNVLNSNGLPSLNFRIGLDSGEAMILTVGSKNLKTHKDLIGQTINLATKIQNLASPNQIMAGEATIRSAYFLYRAQFEKIIIPESWEYHKNDGVPYLVFASKF